MCDIPFEGPQLSTGLAAIPSDPIPSSETVTWQDLGTSAGCLRHLSRSASRLFALALCLSVILSCRQDILHVRDFMVLTMAMIDLSLHTQRKNALPFLCVRNA